jgi:ABC-type multidrug transport system fused ATPase/permease subunit
LKKKISINTIFKDFISQYPRHFSFLFLFLLIEGFTAASSMISIVPMADFLIDPTLTKASKITLFVIRVYKHMGINPTFLSFGILFVLLNIFKGITEVGIRYAILKIKYDVTRNLIGDSLEIFFKAKWGFFSNASSGVLLNTLTKELNTISDTLGHLATLLAQFIQLFIFLSVPMWLNLNLTLTVFGISVLLGLPFLLLNKKLYKIGKQNTESGNYVIAILSELLQATRIILGFGKQRQSKEQFLKAFNEHVKITLLSQTLSTAVPKFFQPLAMMSIVIAIWFAINQNTPISELTAIMWSFLAALPILSSILQGNVSINNFLPSYEQLLNLRSNALEYKEIEGHKEFIKIKDKIEFKYVNFNYPGRLDTLTDLNLIINKGKMTALVGKSGSGKSTITDLILGLQVPVSGEVLIDDVALNNYKQNSFRQKIGYVPQDPMLFDCSIRDNLLWSNENATEFEIWDVLKLANADSFIKELPNGLDTLVGDRGVRLSGGQRQRIALARALIRNPELLILDEATSSLDSESEKLIQNSIENVAQKTTLLVVAHRLSTIAKADQVYVLNNGNIIEEGSFENLITKNDGELTQMLRNQNPSK